MITKCEGENCDKSPTLTFNWPWGKPGAVCGDHAYLPGQVAQNQGQAQPVLTASVVADPQVRLHALLTAAEDSFQLFSRAVSKFHDAAAALHDQAVAKLPPLEGQKDELDSSPTLTDLEAPAQESHDQPVPVVPAVDVSSFAIEEEDPPSACHTHPTRPDVF